MTTARPATLAPSGSTETAVWPAAGQPDESPANRVHRKSHVSQGFFRSRPVSRILSWVTIYLGLRFPGGSSGVPGSSAGSLVAEPVRLAPDGVWRAAVSPRRWWALTPP